ncbi:MULTISPECIES: CAT RNA binding domain-containing protein [Paenibacillus]|uniref:CAT RNA binding domain-containing protein n=1 Tax=Paenibacillus TaxID=44249 RepID=UPI00035F26FB|nr:CAT RNA binding domain-containing protein [Paenibacillus terrigena]
MSDRKITQILSHNTVIVSSSAGTKSILFGRGIGYMKKPGMVIDQEEIAEEYLLLPVYHASNVAMKSCV